MLMRLGHPQLPLVPLVCSVDWLLMKKDDFTRVRHNYWGQLDAFVGCQICFRQECGCTFCLPVCVHMMSVLFGAYCFYSCEDNFLLSFGPDSVLCPWLCPLVLTLSYWIHIAFVLGGTHVSSDLVGAHHAYVLDFVLGGAPPFDIKGAPLFFPSSKRGGGGLLGVIGHFSDLTFQHATTQT